MRSFHQCKRSDNKQYAMDVRWRICFENLTYFFIPWSGRKYSHTNSYNRPFYSSQRHIGNATARTWERGWGWLALNLCERFWWDSYVGSKIVRFLRKIDGPSRNLDKADFSPKRKESSVPLLVVQIHFMAPMVCLRAFTSSSLCTEACIFAKYLSFYTYLILCELWMRVTIVAKLVQIFYKVPELL